MLSEIDMVEYIIKYKDKWISGCNYSHSKYCRELKDNTIFMYWCGDINKPDKYITGRIYNIKGDIIGPIPGR